jgi:hypothetical protein
MDWQPNGSSPKWSICGQVCSEQDAVGALTDDSGFPHLTVIGPDAYRKQVVNDLLGSPHLAQWRDRVRFQDYPADYWALGFGFVTTGQPTIYYQTQDGLVVFRMDKYDGAESLAGALRRSDPSYDPSKDPNGKPSPSLPGLPFDPAKVPTPAYLLAAAAFYLATRKEEK